MAAELAILIPIIGISIPVVAIISRSVEKIYEMKLEYHRGANKSTVDGLEKRVVELENRVVTLQDIIISGDYEVRRRLEQAMAQPTMMHPPHSSTQSISPPSPQRVEG